LGHRCILAPEIKAWNIGKARVRHAFGHRCILAPENELLFNCRQNEKQAQSDWEAYVHNGEVYALLRYNKLPIIMHTTGHDFVNTIEKNLSVF
jgi:hypothetical protein